MNGQRIGVVAVCGGNVGFDRVGHRVHTGVGNQLLRHGLGQLGIDDGDVRRDLEVGDRVLGSLGIVGDDGEGGHFGRRAGSGGNGAEVGFVTQFGKSEDLAHVFEGAFRIFIFDPHGLRRVDGRTAADGNDPVGTEFLHHFGASHHGFDGRVGFDAFENLHFHAGFFQILLGAV